jgi:hypothetical protein
LARSGAILEVIAQARVDEKVPVQLQPSFANDGLFYEWAYNSETINMSSLFMPSLSPHK